MKVSVAGTGYVGLVTAACFADAGHDVTGVDTDEEKVRSLSAGRAPIYEPELEDLLRHGRESRRLRFTTDIARGVSGAEIVFVCVGTPTGVDGRPDLSAVFDCTRAVAKAATGPLLIVIKSTVPVGTNDRLLAEVSSVTDRPVVRGHDVASNPEFMKEGAAVEDFLRPDRVVGGVRTRRAAELLHEIYEPFVRTGAPIIETDPRSAEMAKYASNGMLAVRITFINEIARLCDRLGADVESVRRIVGSDRRIGPGYLFAGPGYGGSCFPKDIRAMTAMGEELHAGIPMIGAVEESNRLQRGHLFKILQDEMVRANLGRELGRSRVAVWGLSFKPRTDDVRESPALELVRGLVEAGAEVAVFDPEAMETARVALSDVAASVRWAEDRYDAAKDADALVLVTEWPEFRRPDPRRLAGTMRGRAVFDWRNILDGKALAGAGFTVRGVGRPVPGTSGDIHQLRPNRHLSAD